MKAMAAKPAAPAMPAAKRERDEADPSFMIKMHTLSGYAYLYLRGKLLDALESLLSALMFWRQASTSAGAAGKRVGPPIWTGWVVFYMRRMYSRIEDCWNRPITGEASSSLNVCVRARVGRGDGAPLRMTGATQRCFNLGSYNYLGFADDWMSTCGGKVLEGDPGVHHFAFFPKERLFFRSVPLQVLPARSFA